MTRERYSLTVRLRGRIFISSIVYFSWTAARGWRMIFPLSLFLSRSPLVYSSPRRAANTGRLMTLRGPPFAGIRVSARRWVVLGGATITSPLHSIPIDSSVTNCIMASSRKDTRGGGGEGIEPWDDVCQPLDNRAAEIHAPRTFRKQGNREMIGADLYGERNCSLGSLPFRSTRLFVNK